TSSRTISTSNCSRPRSSCSGWDPTTSAAFRHGSAKSRRFSTTDAQGFFTRVLAEPRVQKVALDLLYASRMWLSQLPKSPEQPGQPGTPAPEPPMPGTPPTIPPDSTPSPKPVPGGVP